MLTGQWTKFDCLAVGIQTANRCFIMNYQLTKAEYAAKFVEAKTTKKPVELYGYSAPCNDPSEECDLDNVTVYAMPDGTKKTFRNHTWQIMKLIMTTSDFKPAFRYIITVGNDRGIFVKDLWDTCLAKRQSLYFQNISYM